MDETKPTYLTVVFEIHDTEQAKKILDSTIINKIKAVDKKDGYSVIVVAGSRYIGQLVIAKINERSNGMFYDNQTVCELIQQHKSTTNPVTQSVLRQVVCERLSGRENFNDYFGVGK